MDDFKIYNPRNAINIFNGNLGSVVKVFAEKLLE
jgi:hypothetical protein